MIVISLCSELYLRNFLSSFLSSISHPHPPALIPLEWKYASYFAQGQ